MSKGERGSRQSEALSVTQGGGGVSLQFQTQLTQAGVPLSIGKSPGSGTAFTAYLQTNRDPAYVNAVVTVLVVMHGLEVEFATRTLSAARVGSSDTLVIDIGNCGAEWWEIKITLANPLVLPVKPLFSRVMAFGVENLTAGGGSAGDGLSFQGTFVGPGGAPVTVGFGAPPLNETGTYIVTLQARIESSSVDPVGASFSTSATYAWENVAGVVSLVPVILSAPSVDSDPVLATTAAAVGAAAGQATVTFQLPATLDASTVTEVDIALVPLVVA